MLRVSTLFILALSLAFAPSLAGAQDRYPEKPLRFVVPFPPGGGTDGLARILGAKLTEFWGQQVIIDNRGGVQGSVGAGKLRPVTILGEAQPTTPAAFSQIIRAD